MSLNPLFRLQGIPVSLNKAEIRTHLINDPDIRLCLEKGVQDYSLSICKLHRVYSTSG